MLEMGYYFEEMWTRKLIRDVLLELTIILVCGLQ